MPIPTPKENESQDHFMARCMTVLKDENKPQDQKVAICMSQFKRKNGEAAWMSPTMKKKKDKKK